jgi:hypothetical protein
MLRHLHNAIYTCDRCGDKINQEVIHGTTPFPKGWHTVSFGRVGGAYINKDLCTMCSIQVKEVIERSS